MPSYLLKDHKVLRSTQFFAVMLIVFLRIIWPSLAWSADPVNAKLERVQLRNFISGLNVLGDRLTYQQSLLNPKNKHSHHSQAPVFSEYEYIVVAWESSLIGATTEDRARVERLIHTLKELDSAVAAYMKMEVEISDADRERLREVFRDILPTETKVPTTAQRNETMSIEKDGVDNENQPTNKTTKSAWTDLELQYKITLDEIDALRVHFLKQLSSE